MSERRRLLRLGAALAACALLPPRAARSRAATPRPGTLLILGGTGFIGPHLTGEALRAGWRVTHFNRGRHGGSVAPGVETLIGDRKGQLEALRGRAWDVLVDDTGYVPKFVRMSARLLAPHVGFGVFISSISAYASLARPNDESSPTAVPADPDTEVVTEENYGAMKAACERAMMEAFGGRGAVVRPGYIVGPLDPTDRFTYWPVRAATGGEMLAPGATGDPIQLIDVRDLCAWIMRLLESRTRGCFNAVSPAGALTMGALLEACRAAAPSAGTRVTWVPTEFLASRWSEAELDLPPWAPVRGETAAASLTSSARALAAGLQLRPLSRTVADTLAWFESLPPARRAAQRPLLEPQRESDMLAAWHSSQAASN